MQLKARHAYDRPACKVFAAFTDRKMLQAKHEALGARDVDIVKCKSHFDTTEVVVVRELPAQVPGVLKRFLKPWNRVEQRELWHKRNEAQFHAKLTIAIANVPVDIHGTLDIVPDGEGSVNNVRIDVDCRIPIVGGKLAEFVAADCRRLIAAEYAWLKKNLP